MYRKENTFFILCSSDTGLFPRLSPRTHLCGNDFKALPYTHTHDWLSVGPLNANCFQGLAFHRSDQEFIAYSSRWQPYVWNTGVGWFLNAMQETGCVVESHAGLLASPIVLAHQVPRNHICLVEVAFPSPWYGLSQSPLPLSPFLIAVLFPIEFPIEFHSSYWLYPLSLTNSMLWNTVCNIVCVGFLLSKSLVAYRFYLKASSQLLGSMAAWLLRL